MNVADSTFVIFSALVVLLMTPALALFYAGLVERKYATTMLTQNFFAIPLLTLVWAVFGFSLAFGENILGGFVGGSTFMFLQGGFLEANAIAPNIPLALFFVLQATFAIITPALMTGAILGRCRFLPLMLFLTLWSLLVYCPVVHWVWGGGFLRQMGYMDFAGGVPVHMIAGFSALAAVLALGKRKNPQEGPCNLTAVAVGAGLLWVGWFSFNSCGALSANTTAALIVLNTLLASSAGAVAWLVLAYLRNRGITFLDLIFGAVAGLIISSPTSAFLSPWWMIVAAILGTTVCFFAVQFRIKMHWDDTLDVWSLHGVGGVCGALLVGFLANPAYAPVGGLLYGNGSQLLIQFCGVALAMLYSFGLTFLMVKGINRLFPFLTKDGEPENFGWETFD